MLLALGRSGEPILVQGGRYERSDGEKHGDPRGGAAAAAGLTPKPAGLTNKTHMAVLKDQYPFDVIQKGGAALGRPVRSGM